MKAPKIKTVEKVIYKTVYSESVEWGNCRRGCPPSYLDTHGYCSPACRLGAPRGNYITIGQVCPEENGILFTVKKGQVCPEENGILFTVKKGYTS